MIFEPAGMNNSGLIYNTGEDDYLAVQYDVAGNDIVEPVDMSNLYSAGGLYSTVKDIYLFLLLWLGHKRLLRKTLEIECKYLL
jgi:CubicO group peptidase (beta-lactamase class C family)